MVTPAPAPAAILWYIADPMCSWCWGFSPVIEAIRDEYADRLEIALILGGLRPGTSEAVTPEFRTEILEHWRHVHDATGQPFQFDGAMPEGFVYDTEPPSRAVIAVSEIDPEATFAMFRAVQQAFYAEQRDVTLGNVLGQLAADLRIEATAFAECFDSNTVRDKTQAHFQLARQMGVRGFPTVLLQKAEAYRLLTYGYRPLDDLRPDIDRWLADLPE